MIRHWPMSSRVSARACCAPSSGVLSSGRKDRSGLQYLFPNSERGRAAAQAIERGEKIEVIAQTPTRPNIFMLYEQNIGALTPLIADQLRDAEQEFPPQWIEEAFAEAVKQNARSWAYVKKILDNKARGVKRETTGRDIAADWQQAIEKDKRHNAASARTTSQEPECEICGGLGWISANVPMGHPQFGKLLPCPHRQNETTQSAAQQLRHELGPLSNLTLNNFESEGHAVTIEQKHSLRRAVDGVRRFH